MNSAPLRSSVRPLLALALCLSLTPAADAHLALIRQGRESRGALETLDRHGEELCVGDFNGDGYDDLATAAPYEDWGGWPGTDHGAIIINFGSPEGLTHEGAQLIAPPYTETGMLFGFSMASADFENDGYDDLVVGIPFADSGGQAESGALAIYRGSGLGFVSGPLVRDQSWISGAVEAGDRFGQALATGDLDADGYDDLAIGSPGENGGGAVSFVFGGTTGLFGPSSYGFTQNTIGTGSVAGEGFGSSLAIGNFFGLSPLDVAVGCPYEGLSVSTGSGSTGMVAVIGSTFSGPDAGLTTTYTPSSLGISGGANRAFGFALAAGDFDHNGWDDLAIGRPGGSSYAGEIVELHGGASGPVFNSVRTPNDFNANGSHPGDRFGWALASGDFDDDGFDDLFVGSPGHTQFTFTALGRVYLYRSTNGFGLASWTDWQQHQLNVDFEPFLENGYSVAMGYFDDTGRANMVAGSPGAEGNAGRVHVIAGWRQPGVLNGRNAAQFDCDGDLVYSLKPFDPVYIASTAKNMTILIACERTQLPTSDPNHVSLSAVYEVPGWVANNVSGSQFQVVQGEFVTLRALMDMTMSVSGNDAAYAIADLLTGSNAVWNGAFNTVNTFVAEMNVRAQQLGMLDTTFTNPAGFSGSAPESTAYDMAILGRAAIANPLFESVVNNPSWQIPRTVPTGPSAYTSFVQQVGGGFVAALQSQFPEGIGSKDGGTPAAGITGVFQARETFYPWGVYYGSVFNTPPSAGWVVPDAAALLDVARDRCFGGPAVPGQIHPPEPPQIVASATNDYSVTWTPPDPFEKEVKLELFNLVPDGEVTEVGMSVERESTAEIGHLETAVWRAEGVSGHDGITVAYEGEFPAEVEITSNTEGAAVVQLSMSAGDVYDLPPGMLPGGQETFVMSLTVNSNGPGVPLPGSVRVTERYSRDYVFPGDGTGESDGMLFDQTSSVPVIASAYRVELEGQDTDPGHQVGLALHDGSPSFVFDPCPASRENYGAGWPGTHGVPTLALDADPVMGEPITYRLGNSLHADTLGVWFIGLVENDLSTTLGGNVLVKPLLKLTLNVPEQGLEVPSQALTDPAFCGLAFVHQLFLVDDGASDGIAFSRGLRTTIGN